MSEPANLHKNLHDDSRLPDIYGAAIKELEELTSGPKCYRIGALLLHDSCNLLADDLLVRRIILRTGA